MESYYSIFRIIVIVTVSTLVTIFITPVDSSDSIFAARSLFAESEAPAPAPDVMTPISSPENSPLEVDIDSPAASSEALTNSNSPANPPAEMENNYPADAPSDSNAPAEEDVDSPSPSPEALTDSNSPANPPTEMENDYAAEAPSDSNTPAPEEDIGSPAPSPEAPAGSDSPANSPTEMENDYAADAPAEENVDSPAPSPEAPAGSDSPANSPSEENPDDLSPNALAGLKLLNTAKNLLNPEIKSICGKTDNPELCESSVSPLLTAELKPDVTSVLVLAIQASINATKAAMATVNKIAATDCEELYDDAFTKLEEAVNAVKSRDIGTVNTNLSAAMTDYGTCNDGFEESGEPNPLGNVSDKLTKMVSNCLALSTLIK